MINTAWSGLPYRQVDVFADKPLSGNGLGVFWQSRGLSSQDMQALTIELRQFESVFLAEIGSKNRYSARIFTMDEELDFAGHPILGAAAVLHEKFGSGPAETWYIQLRKNTISVKTLKDSDSYDATMFQPAARFVSVVETPTHVAEIVTALNLDGSDLYPGLPPEVVSTGLPYVIVPIQRSIENARVAVGNLGAILEACGAKFAYVYDVAQSEGRTWGNKGTVEDIATGSAAGPVAAYLCKHGLLRVGQELTINQGKYVGRASQLKAKVLGTEKDFGEIEVSGKVRMVSSSILD
jgi:PhzF family phenazine biosynthesis protein